MTLVPDHALLDQLGLTAVAVMADLGGTAPALALAAYLRYRCVIDLVQLDAMGTIGQGPDPAPQHQALIDAGVPAAHLRIVTDRTALNRADLVACPGLFGDTAKIKHLEPMLAHLFQPGGALVLDIRKGTGAYPFLKGFGTTQDLHPVPHDTHTITRVLFRAGPQLLADTAAPDDSWSAIATALAGAGGFFRESPTHSFLFLQRSDTLVVTFDNLDIAMEKREDRRPWGFSFIEKQGWSMLGVMANGWTWYRDPWVWQQFDDLRDAGFFGQFRRVVFYGASMGGYAACAFVAACPGADVVAISPQSTLDKALVPWETRYSTAWARDYAGPYGDAALVSAAARRVTLLYDPYEPLDAAHVARFEAANVMKLRTPLMGHRLGSSLQQMGVLAAITLGALNGTLTELEFYRTIRARKTFQRYQRELFKRALAKGRTGLARKLGRWVLTRGDNRYIRKHMQGL